MPAIGEIPEGFDYVLYEWNYIARISIQPQFLILQLTKIQQLIYEVQ